MTKKEWDRKQLKKMSELLEQDPTTQIEDDIWNLEYMQSNIGYMSLSYRHGCYSSLGRAIDTLKREAQK